MSNYRDQLESYLKTLNIKADRVLDVGGAALPVKGRTKSWEVMDYKIVDNGLEAGKYNYKYDVNTEFWSKLYKNEAKADIIFCLELMEYVINPFKVLNDFSRWMLKDNGILYITFPFIYPVHNPREHDYLRYTFRGIATLLGEARFKILDFKPRQMTDKGYALWQAFIKAEGMHAARRTPHCDLGYIIKAEKC